MNRKRWRRRAHQRRALQLMEAVRQRLMAAEEILRQRLEAFL